jgi:Leucine-rich repeat (LRR) protein
MPKDSAYRKAEKNIQTARESRAEELDLSWNYGRPESEKLSELPKELDQLTQLQTLNLSGNALSALPESLGQLRQLKTLNLSTNQLTALAKQIGQLTQLRTLSLSNNQLTTLPKAVGQLTQLETLNLSNNQLTALPEAIDQLTQLKSADFSKNQLTALPDAVGGLTQLQTLNLSNNQLTALPEALGQLTKLQLLDLSGNRLMALPSSLYQLRKLQSLNLHSSQLTALPWSLGGLTQLESLNLYGNQLAMLPEWFGILTRLRTLDVAGNNLRSLPNSFANLVGLENLYIGWDQEGGGNPLGHVPACVRHLNRLRELKLMRCHLNLLPDWIGELSSITGLWLSCNSLGALPASIGHLTSLTYLHLESNQLTELPATIGYLTRLDRLGLDENQLTEIPDTFLQIASLATLNLDGNPLNPELSAAYKEGIEAVKRYLRAKAEAQVVLNEAKLILIGEGEVGKSCLLGALRGDPWEDGRPTTHGIEIKPVKVTDTKTGTEITLNGWDFGGQRVYRPTHQLFFSAPAVYLVVWKPREGPQQGFVKDWIKLVKHREPDAKILVVATHGGPGSRQPDIDRQEIWDLFGKETVVDFLHVDSRPKPQNGANRTDERQGIRELKTAIASVAARLPEMGRTFPAHWQKAREALRKSNDAWLPLDRVFAICKETNVEDADVPLLLRICRRVGDLIYFEHDPALRDIVVLKPDWLATAISFVLDDEDTRLSRGLVTFQRLGQLWNNPLRGPALQYPLQLHLIFLRLMERFDISYRVAEPNNPDRSETSLIAQLVPDIRPDPVPGWGPTPSNGDAQQVQVCRIVDTAKNQSAAAEGLFYQLIVRLHKFSLGRTDYAKSVHWQRGLLLEDDTGARGFLEHLGNDVRITVRSPYPERFLSALTYEVKWLVESFWDGLRCEVTVPCLRQQNGRPCSGLFEVAKLIENKRRNREEQPCAICNEWQSIEQLLHNAPAARPNPIAELLGNSADMMRRLEAIRTQISAHEAHVIGRLDQVDVMGREIISKVENAYVFLMRTLLDEGKEGPRLFSFESLEGRGFFERPRWMSAKFRLTLWCEHSRLPVGRVSGEPDKGVYVIDLPNDWLVKAAPFLKLLSSTLSFTLPIAAALPKVVLP